MKRLPEKMRTTLEKIIIERGVNRTYGIGAYLGVEGRGDVTSPGGVDLLILDKVHAEILCRQSQDRLCHFDAVSGSCGIRKFEKTMKTC